MAQKFVDNFSSTCRRNINIELTLIRPVVSVGLCDSMTNPWYAHYDLRTFACHSVSSNLTIDLKLTN